VPSNLAQIYISPMQRAQTTLHLLYPTCSPQETQITTTPLLHEWNYGIYEGLTTPEIRALRKGSGLDSDDHDWDIWLDGCEGGELPEDVEKRCDELIREIRDHWHAKYFRGECDRGDVLLVAHGHLLRAFAMRWIGKRLAEKVSMVLEAGGVGTLSYEHGNLREPAILLGGSFVVDTVKGTEKEADEEVKEGGTC
jgi:broad specificity phosphatase PhoE